MGFGLIIGSLINAFAMEQAIIQDYFVNGIFHVIGAAFINSLKMLVVPLVTFSLICGVCGIGDVGALGRIGIKSFLLYILTSLTAGVFDEVYALVQPGIKGPREFVRF